MVACRRKNVINDYAKQKKLIKEFATTFVCCGVESSFPPKIVGFQFTGFRRKSLPGCFCFALLFENIIAARSATRHFQSVAANYKSSFTTAWPQGMQCERLEVTGGITNDCCVVWELKWLTILGIQKLQLEKFFLEILSTRNLFLLSFLRWKISMILNFYWLKEHDSVLA